MKLILASNSPRRREILTSFGYKFTVEVSDYTERDVDKHPVQTAKDNALGKAQSVFFRLNDQTVVVLGADTVVYIDGKILGKPKDDKDAKRILTYLSGKTHTVVTGYAIVSKDGAVVNATESKVTFNVLDNSLIERYVASGLPLDKAGAYGIQDGYPLVKEYSGSLNNIIGLPIEDIKPLLDKLIK